MFPAAHAVAALGPIRELFPTVRPCVDVLDAALTNAGPVIHPPLVLVNAGAIDQGRFDIHAAGTTSSARRLIEVVDAERTAARRGWGYPRPTTSWPRTTRTPALPKGCTAPGPGPSSRPAGSGVSPSISVTGT